ATGIATTTKSWSSLWGARTGAPFIFGRRAGESMARSGRKRVSLGPGNAWQSTLDKLEGHESSQAGEVPAGLEDGQGGGDKGIDALTGGGGYAGDAVESGHDAALAEPDRPTDSE